MTWLASRRHHSSLRLVATIVLASGSASAQVPIFVAPEAEPAAVSEPAAARSDAEALPEAPPPPAGAALPADGVTPAPTLPEGADGPPRSPAKTELHEPSAPAVVDEGDADDAAPKPKRRWYGWQTLIADGSSIFLLLMAAGLEQGRTEVDTDVLTTTALLGYEFVPGIIHFTHKNPGRGFGSMGLRLGMPLAGAFLGASASSGCDEYLCEATGAGLGFLLGMGGAIAIDAAVFAYDGPERPESGRASIAPLVSITPRGLMIGAAGAL